MISSNIMYNHFKDWKVFTFRDVKMLFRNQLNSNAVGVLIHRNIEKGVLHKITNGVYTYSDNVMVYGYAFGDFYYGVGFALDYYDIISQVMNPVIITTSKASPGPRDVNGKPIFIYRIKEDMFFGYTFKKINGIEVPISDVEKTFIDTVYYNFKLEQYVYGIIQQRLNYAKLDEYLKMCPKWLQKRVMNVLNKTYPVEHW